LADLNVITHVFRHYNLGIILILIVYLQCFDTVVGRQEGHPACKKIEWWGAGMVICLGRGADLHMA